MYMAKAEEKQNGNKSQVRQSAGSRLLDFKVPAGTAFLEILNATLM